MYFKSTFRHISEEKTFRAYYRLVESYRNELNRICHRTILNVGYLDDLEPEQLNKIQKHLTNRAEGKVTMFEEEDPEVLKYTELFWHRMVSEKRIDLPEESVEKRKRLVDVDTIKHKDVREIGAEWMGYQALEQLQLKGFLETLGWSDLHIQLTLTQLISRAVYPASELKTSRWIKENSAICELTGYPLEKMTKDKLYQNALSLYKIKDDLEQFLSRRTNELFDLEDKIILYDLTNTYFEGEKRNSSLAKFGRSKEKRSDAKLVVLALVVNAEGFLKYSNIFEGNTSDSTTIPSIIENLRINTSQSAQKATVVIDAGIATEDNLELIKNKGYNYICVSRKTLKDYKAVEGSAPQLIATNNKQQITVQKVTSDSCTDYYLKVKSPGKELKETAMKSQFESRFEEELSKIKAAVDKKFGTKKADKIHQRIGRAKEKYPSVSKYYVIDIETNDKGIVTQIKWNKEKGLVESVNLGVYFVRTNLPIEQETELWQAYNTIREIESSFRCLKTDLDLRPIYHKNDDATLAHLHLGLLGYWLVNTIRYQLKQQKINHSWQEIVRIGNTQKVVTTTGINQYEEVVSVRRCSEPNQQLSQLYQALRYKTHPFVKRKSVVHKPEFQNFKQPSLWDSSTP